MSKFRPIDYKNWKRRDIYEQFQGFQYTLTMQMDMTELYRYIKANGKKFYPVIGWVLTKTAYDAPDYRFMKRDGKVGIMEDPGTNFTLLRDADPTMFTHGVTPYDPDLDVYYENFLKNQLAAQAEDRLYYNAEASADAVDISITPKLSFQSLSLSIPPSFYSDPMKGKFTPFTTVGRYHKEGDRVMLPVCTNFHHCVNDGYHAQKYFELLQANLDAFADRK